jgi:hypothetical protein
LPHTGGGTLVHNTPSRCATELASNLSFQSKLEAAVAVEPASQPTCHPSKLAHIDCHKCPSTITSTWRAGDKPSYNDHKTEIANLVGKHANPCPPVPLPALPLSLSQGARASHIYTAAQVQQRGLAGRELRGANFSQHKWRSNTPTAYSVRCWGVGIQANPDLLIQAGSASQ